MCPANVLPAAGRMGAAAAVCALGGAPPTACCGSLRRRPPGADTRIRNGGPPPRRQRSGHQARTCARARAGGWRWWGRGAHGAEAGPRKAPAAPRKARAAAAAAAARPRRAVEVLRRRAAAAARLPTVEAAHQTTGAQRPAQYRSPAAASCCHPARQRAPRPRAGETAQPGAQRPAGHRTAAARPQWPPADLQPRLRRGARRASAGPPSRPAEGPMFGWQEAEAPVRQGAPCASS